MDIDVCALIDLHSKVSCSAKEAAQVHNGGPTTIIIIIIIIITILIIISEGVE